MRLWNTPTSSDANGAGHGERGNGKGPGLVTAVSALSEAKWATPTARDEKGPSNRADKHKAGADLPGQVMPFTTTSSAKLNPDWVETLMGFPVGWTIIAGPLRRPTSKARPRRSTPGSPLAPSVDREEEDDSPPSPTASSIDEPA
jgi:hypothetical protein